MGTPVPQVAVPRNTPAALQKSEYVGHREVGQQIQRLAEHPDHGSWPD